MQTQSLPTPQIPENARTRAPTRRSGRPLTGYISGYGSGFGSGYGYGYGSGYGSGLVDGEKRRSRDRKKSRGSGGRRSDGTTYRPSRNLSQTFGSFIQSAINAEITPGTKRKGPLDSHPHTITHARPHSRAVLGAAGRLNHNAAGVHSRNLSALPSCNKRLVKRRRKCFYFVVAFGQLSVVVITVAVVFAVMNEGNKSSLMGQTIAAGLGAVGGTGLIISLLWGWSILRGRRERRRLEAAWREQEEESERSDSKIRARERQLMIEKSKGMREVVREVDEASNRSNSHDQSAEMRGAVVETDVEKQADNGVGIGGEDTGARKPSAVPSFRPLTPMSPRTFDSSTMPEMTMTRSTEARNNSVWTHHLDLASDTSEVRHGRHPSSVDEIIARPIPSIPFVDQRVSLRQSSNTAPAIGNSKDTTSAPRVLREGQDKPSAEHPTSTVMEDLEAAILEHMLHPVIAPAESPSPYPSREHLHQTPRTSVEDADDEADDSDGSTTPAGTHVTEIERQPATTNSSNVAFQHMGTLTPTPQFRQDVFASESAVRDFGRGDSGVLANNGEHQDPGPVVAMGEAARARRAGKDQSEPLKPAIPMNVSGALQDQAKIAASPPASQPQPQLQQGSQAQAQKKPALADLTPKHPSGTYDPETPMTIDPISPTSIPSLYTTPDLAPAMVDLTRSRPSVRISGPSDILKTKGKHTSTSTNNSSTKSNSLRISGPSSGSLKKKKHASNSTTGTTDSIRLVGPSGSQKKKKHASNSTTSSKHTTKTDSVASHRTSNLKTQTHSHHQKNASTASSSSNPLNLTENTFPAPPRPAVPDIQKPIQQTQQTQLQPPRQPHHTSTPSTENFLAMIEQEATMPSSDVLATSASESDVLTPKRHHHNYHPHHHQEIGLSRNNTNTTIKRTINDDGPSAEGNVLDNDETQRKKTEARVQDLRKSLKEKRALAREEEREEWARAVGADGSLSPDNDDAGEDDDAIEHHDHTIPDDRKISGERGRSTIKHNPNPSTNTPHQPQPRRSTEHQTPQEGRGRSRSLRKRPVASTTANAVVPHFQRQDPDEDPDAITPAPPLPGMPMPGSFIGASTQGGSRPGTASGSGAVAGQGQGQGRGRVREHVEGIEGRSASKGGSGNGRGDGKDGDGLVGRLWKSLGELRS